MNDDFIFKHTTSNIWPTSATEAKIRAEHEKKHMDQMMQDLDYFHNKVYLEKLYNNFLNPPEIPVEITNAFPYRNSVHSSSYRETFVKNNNLQKSIDYEIVLGSSDIFFKNESDKDNFEKYQQDQKVLERTISESSNILEKNYSRIVFAKKNNLTVSINFRPLKGDFHNIIDALLDFYIINEYTLPETSENFLDHMFFINKEKMFYTALLKNEEDAAALILKLSDLAEVVK